MSKKTTSQRAVNLILMIQLIIPCVIALSLLIFVNQNAAVSALLGGVVGFIPSLIFASKLFKSQGAQAARQIVSNFYKGEFLKILTAIILFILAFSFFRISPLAFFLTYIAVVMTFWLSPLLKW